MKWKRLLWLIVSGIGAMAYDFMFRLGQPFDWYGFLFAVVFTFMIIETVNSWVTRKA